MNVTTVRYGTVRRGTGTIYVLSKEHCFLSLSTYVPYVERKATRHQHCISCCWILFFNTVSYAGKGT